MFDYREKVFPNGEYVEKRDVFSTKVINGDEYYTLPQHVEDIFLAIGEHRLDLYGKVWFPFDTEDSEFVKYAKKHGIEYVNTSTDFFKTPVPAGVGCIVSNPPFSRKKEILKRIKEYQLPYALILPHMWLNDGIPFDFGHQLIFWRKRVRFKGVDGVARWPRTSCFVLSDGLLENDLTIYHDR